MSIHCEWAFVEISAEFSQTRFTTGIRIAGEGARGGRGWGGVLPSGLTECILYYS